MDSRPTLGAQRLVAQGTPGLHIHSKDAFMPYPSTVHVTLHVVEMRRSHWVRVAPNQTCLVSLEEKRRPGKKFCWWQSTEWELRGIRDFWPPANAGRRAGTESMGLRRSSALVAL